MTEEPEGEGSPGGITIGYYDVAFFKVFQRLADQAFAQHPILSHVERQVTEHCGPVRNVPGPEPLDQGPFAAQDSLTLDAETIRSSDCNAFAEQLAQTAIGVMNAGSRAFHSRMTEMCDHSGQTVSAGGKPATWDLILDMLEKVHIDFEPDGRPRLPTLALPPAVRRRLAAQPMTEAQEARQERILKKKLEEFNARRRTRRLP